MSFALLAVILFSLSAVSATKTARALGGIEANFWRLSVAALLLGFYAHSFGPGLTGPVFPILTLSGILGFGLGDFALFQALPRLGTRLAIMIVHCLATPIAGVIEWVWLDVRVDLAELACAVAILVGVAVALVERPGSQLPNPHFVSGIVFGCLAALGQSSGAVLSRRAFAMAQESGFAIDGITAAYQRIAAGVIVSGVLLLLLVGKKTVQMTLENRGGMQTKWNTVGPWIVFNGIAGPALGVSCYQWALKTTPTAIVLPIVALTPLAVIPLAQRLEGEKPSFRSLVGGIIAVSSTAFLAWLRVN